MLLTQATVEGEIEKFASGGSDMYMGTTDPADTPQGFEAKKLTENEFGNVNVPLELVVPQDRV